MSASILPPIDYPEFRRRLDDDDELIAEVIAIFLEDYPARLAELQQALDAGDWSQVRATAHALKGAASNLASDGTATRAGQLELACGGPDTAAILVHCGALEAEVRRLAQALESIAAGEPR